MDTQALVALQYLLSRQAIQGQSPAEAELEELASALARWSESANLAGFRRAAPHEELLYPLHVTATGPSAYLVSDGVHSQSPPHEHQTWAVIVGIAGRELNRAYEPGPSGKLNPWFERLVGPRDLLILDATAIHSTAVAGSEPTFHLHVYGQALERLPPFISRTYEAP
jgi:predicted metal-dependent enzyme (double-stranded beta helix superfamily)